MIHRRSVLAGGLSALTLGLCRRQSAQAQTQIQAQARRKSSGPPNGALLIIGGGLQGPEIGQAARRLSGGAAAHWVYIPTAADDLNDADAAAPNNLAASGATVTQLRSWNRAEADSEAFVAPLRAATAVYFNGGRQWRLVDAYAGTRTEREIRGVLDRGGLIAGTSAGASIQASYLVRGARSGNGIMVSPGHERGFGYLENAAIDQHVLARGRALDMAKVVTAHPELLGIAIDEGTAAIVEKNTMTVIGRSVILIPDGASHDGQPFYALPSGTRFDLAT